jgi:dTDP-4-dehydrorhamnose reductase
MQSNQTRLLVTGATGMLGAEVVKRLKSGLKYRVFSISRKTLQQDDDHFNVDLSNEKALQTVLDKIQPAIIIHCAAEVNVNRCETEKEYVYKLHVAATQNLVQYASLEKFIYISTDAVFDGQRGNYSETDIVNPLNHYAYTKLKGEETVLSANKNSIVLRTNIVGYHIPLQTSLFEWAYKSLSTNTAISGYENVYFNPLYCAVLAEKIAELLELQFERGIYHIGTTDNVSKFDFLRRTAQYFNFSQNLISPVMLDNSPGTGAMRPLNTTLNTDKVQGLGIVLPSIDASINLLFNDFTKALV